jgi:hypothetical protein
VSDAKVQSSAATLQRFTFDARCRFEHTCSQLRACASRLPKDHQLAIRSRPHWLGRNKEFRKAAGDAPSAIVAPARVVRHRRAIRRRVVHRRFRQCSPSNRQVQRQARRNASHEFSFPSAPAGSRRVAQHCHVLELSRFDVLRPCGFSLCAGYSRPPRMNRGLAAHSRASIDLPRRPPRVMHRRLSFIGDVPLPAGLGFVTGSDSSRRSGATAT